MTLLKNNEVVVQESQPTDDMELIDCDDRSIEITESDVTNVGALITDIGAQVPALRAELQLKVDLITPTGNDSIYIPKELLNLEVFVREYFGKEE